MSEASIGIMEGAFFVPKSEILNWINSLLQLNLTKIEQLGPGSVYCQIIDVLYPGTVKLNRVNWKARNEWEFIVNLKTLQQAFQKNNIKKYIEIEKLSKAKYQDNLEFAQWMKRYFDLNNGAALAKDYDALGRRGNSDTEFSFIELRDNSRMAAMRGGRNDESSDGKYMRNNKMVTRSKSPITKPVSRDFFGSFKNQKGSRLSRKCEQCDTLLAKFNEIHAIINSTDPSDTPDSKLSKVSIISAYVKAHVRSHSNEESNNSPKHGGVGNASNSRQSIDRFQPSNVIREEESPTPESRIPSKVASAVKKPAKSVNDSNNTSHNTSAVIVDDVKNEKKQPKEKEKKLGVNNISVNAASVRLNKHSESLKTKGSSN